MTDVDILVDRLVEQHRRTPPLMLQRRVANSALLGAAITLVLVLAWGLRPDIAAASATSGFWVKLGFGAGFAVAGLAGLLSLFRPERPAPRLLWLTAIPVAFIVAAALREAAAVPDTELTALWLGKTAFACPFAIVALSIAPSIALIMAGRRSAPTKLKLTGGVIGLASGGISATLYALHCPETGMAFVATWYLIGIILATVIGAICGPRLLRW
ncbi:MAG: NrsF family protein [Novosphingobium sp.]